MHEVLHFDDLHVGDRWTSQGRTVTETDVVNFAGLTGDFDPLHVDHHFASKSAFGRPVAHGLLGLSYLAGLSSSCPRVNTAAFVAIRDWHFKQPILFGDTIYAVTEVQQLGPSGRRHGLVIWHRQLINQKNDVLQEGILETLVAVAPANLRTIDEPHPPHRRHTQRQDLRDTARKPE